MQALTAPVLDEWVKQLPTDWIRSPNKLTMSPVCVVVARVKTSKFEFSSRIGLSLLHDSLLAIVHPGRAWHQHAGREHTCSNILPGGGWWRTGTVDQEQAIKERPVLPSAACRLAQAQGTPRDQLVLPSHQGWHARDVFPVEEPMRAKGPPVSSTCAGRAADWFSRRDADGCSCCYREFSCAPTTDRHSFSPSITHTHTHSFVNVGTALTYRVRAGIVALRRSLTPSFRSELPFIRSATVDAGLQRRETDLASFPRPSRAVDLPGRWCASLWSITSVEGASARSFNGLNARHWLRSRGGGGGGRGAWVAFR